MDALGVLLLARGPSAYTPATREPRRRRIALATGLTAFSVVVAGGGAAVAAGFTTHTGFFGWDGAAHSEWLQPGAPDFLPYARQLTAHTQFAPGDSAEHYWWIFLVNKNADGTYVQFSTTGVKSNIADAASCSWQRAWLTAHQASDHQAMQTASTALHQAARSEDLRNNNNASYTEHLIDAADSGDLGPMQTSLRMACPTPKPTAP